MLYIITDYNHDDGSYYARQYIDADTPKEARRLAGPMPTLKRSTVLARVTPDGRIVTD